MKSLRMCAVLAAAGLMCFAVVFGFGATESTQTVAKASSKATAESGKKLLVYYFHGGVRCTNCINFEKYTDELMKTKFADAIKSGRLVWQVVNTDEKANKHFMKDYQLYTKSIVLVDAKDGKTLEYKNLTGIWQVIGSKSKFQDYVSKEVSAYLGKR